MSRAKNLIIVTHSGEQWVDEGIICAISDEEKAKLLKGDLGLGDIYPAQRITLSELEISLKSKINLTPSDDDSESKA